VVAGKTAAAGRTTPAAPAFAIAAPATALAALGGPPMRGTRGDLLMRRWLWGGCGRAGGGEAFPAGAGEEGGGWGRFLHGQFLDAQIVSNLQEAGQRVGAPEVKTDGSEPLVETPDDVEDEGAVGDGFTEMRRSSALRL